MFGKKEKTVEVEKVELDLYECMYRCRVCGHEFIAKTGGSSAQIHIGCEPGFGGYAELIAISDGNYK